jgi:small-conductance mechanosensitive channel
MDFEKLEAAMAQGADWRPLLLSLILLFAVLFVRAAGLRVAGSLENAPDVVRLRWKVQIRRGVITSLVVGLIVIWGSELRELAFSLVAVAVAIVIASKELILCFMGAIVRAASGSFGIGDRVEIAGVRGDVIDHGFLTSTILEIGPAGQRTGRSVVLPNALFLSHSVVNETFTSSYILHLIEVPVAFGEDIERAERILLRAADEVTGQYVREAKIHLQGGEAIEPRLQAIPGEQPQAEPRVLFRVADPETIQLLLRVPTPARRKGDVEQAILRRFITEWTRVAKAPHFMMKDREKAERHPT